MNKNNRNENYGIGETSGSQRPSVGRGRGRGGYAGAGGRGRGQSGGNSGAGGRGRGSPYYANLSGQSVPDLHQATQAPNQLRPVIRPPSSANSAGSSSQANEMIPSQMERQFQQLSIQTEGTSSKAIQPSSESMPFPLRPGKGQNGKHLRVKANHFSMELTSEGFYQYNVSITPLVKFPRLNWDLIWELSNQYKLSHLGNLLLSYDGQRSLYTARSLPFTSKEFEVTLINEAGVANKYVVEISFAVYVDLNQSRSFLKGYHADMPQEAIQALDIVLRQKPTTSGLYPAKQSFYSSDFGRMTLYEGVEAWRGFYQSVRPTQMGLSLNMDLSSAVFVEPLPVIDFVVQKLRRDISAGQLSDDECLKIKKALKGVKIEVTHRGNIRRKYRINDLTSEITKDLTFPFGEDGTTKYIVQYFQETYGLILRHTFLPCLQVGNKQNPNYLPMEVCKIVGGQRYTKRLSDNQVATLVKVNCQRPKQREEDIRKMLCKNDYEKDEYAKEFGIKINKQFASVQARLLTAPRLKYHDSGSDRICMPRLGQWNMMNKKMVNGGTVNNWRCISFAYNVTVAHAHEFCRELARMCSISGMAFNPEPVLPPYRARNNQPDKELKALHKETMAKLNPHSKELDLLIVILPENNGSLYGELKRICETQLGLVSQCCLVKHVFQMKPQYMANVALKINVKVGGRNTLLEDTLRGHLPMVSDKPTIIFGADVTHPRPNEDWSPSIAAVVASQDWPHVTKYACLLSAQTARQEIIQDLFTVREDPTRGKITGGMIREHLLNFYNANGKRKPERIIFYRDGVSEGQFRQVLDYELRAIQKAWTSLESTSTVPPITFVVVQKRHHTRLFPDNHNDLGSVDKSGNIQPGTVVDSQICHRSQFDFYLCSHAGIQGTSRPAHYHVLWDDNKFTADQLQALTNNLCYIYARCTRAVSYVAPAYYAHLAASRARSYLGYHLSSDGNPVAGPSEGRANTTQAVDVPVRELPDLCENLKNVMFYC